MCVEERHGFQDYYRAAKLLVSCPRERLPVVVDLIQKSGINMDEVEKERMLAESDRQERLLEIRKSADKSKWLPTDNSFVLFLREAFDEGISFKEVCNMTGLNKSTVYRCLWGERKGTAHTQALIREAIEKIRCKN